jgi:hypothetical protein
MIRQKYAALLGCGCLVLSLAGSSLAATVWTGPTITFSKPSGGLPTDSANQDHLTSHVWLTRGTSAGMFNIAPGQETSFSATSPKDTMWATSLVTGNSAQAITATNCANLMFDTWQNAFGGSGSLNSNITTHDAVVHLLTDDIYLNLRFTSFASGQNNGAFTYVRSTPVPEPAAICLLLTGIPAAVALLRRRRTSCLTAR